MDRLKLHFMIAVIQLLLQMCWRIDGHNGSPLVGSGAFNYAKDIGHDLSEEMDKII